MPYGQPRGTKKPGEPPTGTPGTSSGSSSGAGGVQVDLEPLIAKIGMVEVAVQGVAGAIASGNVQPADDQIAGMVVVNSNQVMIVNNRRHIYDLHNYGTLIITPEAELTIWNDLKNYGTILNYGILKG